MIDTEGDTAIDVFYLTRDGDLLPRPDLPGLEQKIVAAIAANAG